LFGSTYFYLMTKKLSTKLESQASLLLSDERLSIAFKDGVKRDFHLTWLRDHCPCPSCIHPATRQKLHSSGHVSLHQTITSAKISGEQLKVNWAPGSVETAKDSPNGHTSSYCLNFLKDFNPRVSHSLKHILWEHADFERAQQKVAYKDLMGSDDAFKIILKQLKDYGLAFVKDVPREITQVETLAEKFGPIRNTFYGKSWNVRSVPDARNIAYTALKLDLHMDLMCALVDQDF
jgi:gamma-butyrobetaine dioxygenase